MRGWVGALLLVALAGGVAAPPVGAQQACEGPAVVEVRAPQFPGVIVLRDRDEGVRALRAEVGTPYYVAFLGSNFTDAGALSPDGRFFAMPYGSIQTAATSDVRYRVSEIRVQTTARVPQIYARIPWDATFQNLGRPDDIPSILWLDSDSLLFEAGAFSDQRQQVTLPDGEITASALSTYQDLAPDLARGFRRVDVRRGLFDVQTGDLLAEFAADARAVWMPDSSRFALVSAATLTVHDRDGAPLERLTSIGADFRLWNFAWSPQATGSEARYVFSLYDPYRNENYLYVGSGRSITPTCIRLANQHDGRTESGVVWSPDGSTLALVGYDGGIYLYDFETLRRIEAAVLGGLLAWRGG